MDTLCYYTERVPLRDAIENLYSVNPLSILRYRHCKRHNDGIADCMGEAQPLAPSFGAVVGVDASASDRFFSVVNDVLGQPDEVGCFRGWFAGSGAFLLLVAIGWLF